jgi:AmmeMemoRadiSam system protein B
VAAASCHKETARGSEAGAGAPEPALVKPPNVAGSFYPGDAEKLSADVESRLGAAEPSLEAEDVIAVVTPHAGYEYSGGVAATAFRQLEGRHPATVVLLGPSHHCATDEIATGTYDGYETPLGVVPVDAPFVKAVAERCPEVAFTNVPFAAEHCLEVQLPFVQKLFGETRIAPFIFCRHDAGAAESFGKALAAAIEAHDRDVLIVATCDLSHYHPYDEAVKLDRAFLATFERFDPAEIYQRLESGDFEIDAPGPVAATFWCAKELGATKAVTLDYKNSGDVTGDASRGVVGYIAAAVLR